MLDKKHIKLYIRVFLVLFVIGVVFPYIINLFLGKFLMIEDNLQHGNSIFVIYNNDYKNTFFNTFFKLLAKFMEF